MAKSRRKSAAKAKKAKPTIHTKAKTKSRATKIKAKGKTKKPSVPVVTDTVGETSALRNKIERPGRRHMLQDKTTEVSEAEIAVHWQEEDYVKPPAKFVAQANLTDKTVFERFSLDNFPDCFKEYADLLDWTKDLGPHARHE